MTYSMKDLRRLRRAMACHKRRFHNYSMGQVSHNLGEFGGIKNLPQFPSRAEQEAELQTYMIAGLRPIEIVRDLQRQSKQVKNWKNPNPVSLKLA